MESATRSALTTPTRRPAAEPEPRLPSGAEMTDLRPATLARYAPVQAVAGDSPAAQLRIQGRAPIKWNPFAGDTPEKRLNGAIDAYNRTLDAGAPLAERLARLTDVRNCIAALPDSKAELAAALTVEADREQAHEQRKADAVAEVMALARARAAAQERAPVFPGDNDEALKARLADVEVSHATNPLALVGGGRSIGDSLAATREIPNVHQTGKSIIGGGGDSPKRKTAEVGTFYPERYRRASFSRTAHDNPSPTKGLDPNVPAPDEVLPKYAALNLAGSDFGALADTLAQETLPLHFAIKPEVLRARATITSSDSLRQWSPTESDHGSLVRAGAVSPGAPTPTDASPWDTGPVATFDGANFGQVIRAATGGSLPEDRNPDSYVEAQIHGDLRIDRDISHVRANFAKLFGNPRFAALHESLLASGTEIRWYYRGDIVSGDKLQEGNLLTQTSRLKRADPFAAAWESAAALWTASNASLDAKAPDMADGLKTSGWLAKPQRDALRELWEKLKAAQPAMPPRRAEARAAAREEGKEEKREKST